MIYASTEMLFTLDTRMDVWNGNNANDDDTEDEKKNSNSKPFIKLGVGLFISIFSLSIFFRFFFSSSLRSCGYRRARTRNERETEMRKIDIG